MSHELKTGFTARQTPAWSDTGMGHLQNPFEYLKARVCAKLAHPFHIPSNHAQRLPVFAPGTLWVGGQQLLSLHARSVRSMRGKSLKDIGNPAQADG